MKKNQSNEVTFVPVKKVLDIINSCESEEQLKSCLRIIGTYTKTIKAKGVVNSELVRKRLMKEYKQKKFQLTMIGEFVSTYHKEHAEEFAGVSPIRSYYEQ